MPPTLASFYATCIENVADISPLWLPHVLMLLVTGNQGHASGKRNLLKQIFCGSETLGLDFV